MTELFYVAQPGRALIEVKGEDRREFLQGLVSNDVTRATETQGIWSALLTPQGKFLHEFFMLERFGAERDGAILLECEAARRADLAKKLSLYKLRSRVTVAPIDGVAVFTLIGAGAAKAVGVKDEPGAAGALAGGLVMVDPRLAEAGLRAWLPAGAEAALAAVGFAPGAADAWDRLRIRLGLPDGSRDMEVDRAILLENGFDELHGVDWKKGCYMGQELTARTKYRALIKKRLMPVEIDGPLPAPGTKIMRGTDEAGEFRSSAAGVGLALIRLEELEKSDGELRAGESRLKPFKPDWAVF